MNVTAGRTVTMRDVAELANVSVQTVSTVVNGKPGITKATEARVHDAIDRLGYRPFSIARSLRTRQTKSIALIVHDISNPFFAEIAGVAEDIARSAGYSMVLYNTHDDVDREADYIQRATGGWLDGVLFVSTKDHMKSLETLRRVGIPSVAVERVPDEYSGPSVTMDNERAGRMAAEHLLALGHRRFAHVTGPLWLRSARSRLAGYRAVIEAAGLQLPEESVLEGNWECVSGHSAVQQLLRLEPRPTAIFLGNDRMAIGALLAIHQAGLRVPDDISIVGLDDIEVAAFQIPPLTTIRQSSVQLATRGVELLLDTLAGREPAIANIVIEPIWVERESTARCIE